MRGVIISKQRCKGCDCRNETREPEQTGTGYTLIDWPCVGDDAIAPMSYFALFECSHPHPEGGSGTPFGGQMHWATAELRKECLTTGKYSQEPGAFAPYPTHPVYGSLQETTPPTVFGTNAIVRPRWVGETLFGGLRGGLHDADDDSDWLGRYWTLLDVTASPVQMTWLGSSVVPAPVYESVNAWNLWGRNEMRLTDASQALWPSLKHNVCVVSGDRPTLHNDCDDVASRCKCRDLGGIPPVLEVTLDCQNYPGTQTLTFERFKTPEGLPCGINFPDTSPCGLFFPLGGMGGVEPSCFPRKPGATAAIDNTEFTLSMWCDGENYHIEAYCKFYSATGTGSPCWESQGECVVTQLPGCRGMALAFETPPLECCCEADPPIETGCCPDNPVPRVLYADVSSTGCPALNGLTIPLTYDAELNWWASAGLNLILACSSGAWAISFQGFTNGCDFGTAVVDATTASCDPFELTWVGLANISTFCCVGETVDVSVYP